MLPNFFLVGAAKSGTTYIYECLSKHPNVFLPLYRSEVHFFDRNYQKGLNYYEKKYHKWRGEEAVGDMTPSYMQDLNIANLIYKNFPNAKIIFCLRNPVKRSHSAYWHIYRNTKFNYSFRECFNQRHSIFKQSLYYEKVKKYYDLFPPKNILVLIYKDLKKKSCKIS